MKRFSHTRQQKRFYVYGLLQRQKKELRRSRLVDRPKWAPVPAAMLLLNNILHSFSSVVYLWQIHG